MDAEKDLKAFARLRNYYRKNFRNGESDEAFLAWCDGMCRKIAEEETCAENAT